MNYERTKKVKLIGIIEELIAENKNIKTNYEKQVNLTTGLMNDRSNLYYELSKYELDFKAEKIKEIIDDRKTLKKEIIEIANELLARLQIAKES